MDGQSQADLIYQALTPEGRAIIDKLVDAAAIELMRKLHDALDSIVVPVGADK